jgi:hypothetical protein
VASFERLISYCTGYGNLYNPPNASIRLPALNMLLSNARSSVAAVNTAIMVYHNAVNNRTQVFAPLKRRTTRIVKEIDAKVGKKGTIEDVKDIVKRIEKCVPEENVDETPVNIFKVNHEEQNDIPVPDIKHISESQSEYDECLEGFSELITLLQREPLYAPSDADLRVKSIASHVTNIQAANVLVLSLITGLNNLRIARDKVMYDRNSGLVAKAGEVKKYVKSIYGNESFEYKQLSGLKFS